MDYSGTANTTIGGLTCQAWSVQEPHSHGYSVSEHGMFGVGDHNYCRNPDPTAFGVWCHTTNPNIRWDYCPVPPCVPTVKVLDFSLDVDDEMDYNGSYTSATLEKEDLPPSFTICAAYMVEAWTTEFWSADMFRLNDDNGFMWGYVSLFAATAHCSKVSYRTFLSGKLPVFIVTAPNFQNMSYLGIHLKSRYMP